MVAQLSACLAVMFAAASDGKSAPASPASSPSPASAGAVGGIPEAAAIGLDGFTAGVHDDGKGNRLPYRLYAPRRDPGEQRRYPLVVFLHGAGGRGTDNLKQLTDQAAPLVFVDPQNQRKWPVYMLAPQCPPDQQWVGMPWGTPTGKGARPRQPTWPLAATMALVDQLLKGDPGIDEKRMFVTGMSMGGFGAWDLAARQPSRWRAAVVVCGGYDELEIAPLVRVHLPLWAFHAADDHAVPVARSREMIAALRAAGATPRYTEYPASDHVGHFSWRPAYADPELLPWMFGPPEGVIRNGAPRSDPSAKPATPDKNRK